MLLEIGVIVLMLLVSGLFAGTDTAMAVARPGRLAQLAEEGSRGAATALDLRENPDHFHATLQAVVTLISMIVGVVGGVGLSNDVRALLIDLLPASAPLASLLALVVVVVGLTYLSLVVGQLMPRRVASANPEVVAALMARMLSTLVTLSRPLLAILHWSVELLLVPLRLLGRRPPADAGVTEEDIRQLVEEGAQGGTVEPQEQQIIEGVFKLSERTVRQIMTPRIDVYGLEASARIGDVLDELIEVGYSRYPVYENSLDETLGMVHIQDLLSNYRANGEDARVRSAMVPPTIVPENARADTLLTTFRKNQRHLAVVVSELGSVEGVVTLEDVLEVLVGEILDEHDEIEAQAIIVRDDGSLLIDGALPIDQLKQRLDLDELPDEDLYQYDTLAGMLLSLLGRIPRAGESTSWAEWRFEVVDMDALRIDKVLVQHQPASTPDTDTTTTRQGY